MVLTKSQIASAAIVVNGHANGERDTTYDATVGEILLDGKTIGGNAYDLEPRGVVWVVSREEFHLPDNITGLATLRTTWTHDGVLALNVGVVDPGWRGPVTTALVNFSDKPFTVTKGEQFFRILFFEHLPTGGAPFSVSRSDYLARMRDKSCRTTSSFLNIKALATEVVDQVLITPRWLNKGSFFGLIMGFAALIVAIISIFFPIAYGVSAEWAAKKDQIEILKEEVDGLKAENAKLSKRMDVQSERFSVKH